MNKLTFTKIEIENFRSIKNKVTLDIKSGLYTIEGINCDEKGTYNGAGKSSLVSAFYWCLTGNALTNETLADDVINSIAKKNCKVSVYITSDQGEVKVTRTRKYDEFGNNLIFEINGQNLSCHKITDTQDRINQFIKIPLDILKNTLIMSATMESAFSELTPNQRVQLLENIRDYTVWNKVRDNANKDIKDYAKEIKATELEISNLQGNLAAFTKILEETKSDFIEKDLKFKSIDYTKILADNNAVILSLNDEINKLREKKNSLQDSVIEDNTKDLRVKLSDIKERGLNLQSQKNKLEQEKSSNIANIKYELKKLEDTIGTIDKWFTDDICPTCKRKLDRTVEEIEEKTKQKNLLLLQKTELLNKQTTIDLDLTNKVKTIDTAIVNLRDEYAQVDTQINTTVKINSEIPNKIRILDNEISTKELEKSKAKQSIDQANYEIKSHENLIVEYNDKKSKYESENTRLVSEINAKQTELIQLEKKRKISMFFYDLLGPKGNLRPYLLKQDIEYLNTFIQHYIARFFNNTNVALQLEDNNINIIIKTNEGIIKTVSSLSGGEKKRLNLAIQLGLYDLMQNISQVNFNTLWLDEVETQMDPIGCQQLIEIIEDKAAEIETVYWITNNDMVKENITNKIICRKQNGVTSVEEI